MVSQIQAMGTDEANLQNEVSTGQSVTQPEDDPAAMNSILNLVSQDRALTQYGNNAATALDISEASYSGLSQIKNIADRVGELATEANNGTNSASQMQSYATELNQLIEQSVQLGNTQYNNNYLYSGTAVTTAPYSVTRDASGNISNVSYVGNNSQAQIPLSSTASIAPTTDGATNQSLATLMNQMVTLRDAMTSNDTTTIAATVPTFTTAEDAVINGIATNSAVQTRISTEQSQQTSLSTSLDTIISSKASADLPSTLVKLNQVQTAYQAVLESSAKIMQMSLLNYITV